MGIIFGISDLPVSTIMTPFEPVTVSQNPLLKDLQMTAKTAEKLKITEDKFIPKELTRAKSPNFISMRNGFGKLMKHFSKKISK